MAPDWPPNDGTRPGSLAALSPSFSGDAEYGSGNVTVTGRVRWHSLGVLAALVIVGTSSTALAQGGTAEATAGGEPRSWQLTPTIRLRDVGWDDNVFSVSKDDNPIGDFTTTISPALDASLRAYRLRVSGRSEVDFLYFKRVTQFRAIDSVGGVRVEWPLSRTTPYIGADWASTRHRRNFEIDLPVRRVDLSWNAGVNVQLSGKTSIGVTTRRSRLDYKGDTIYLDSDLAQALGATAAMSGMSFRYALTPLTMVGAEFELDQTEFPAAADRNSDGFRLMSFVEFQPVALVSGRAEVGIRRRSFLDESSPPFRGMVARFDLAYTVLERTRFTVSGQRDLSYSYRADERDYLQAGVQFSVTQRLANAWDVGGSVGRFGLIYGLGDPTGIRRSRVVETVINYAMDVGYRIDRTRVGFQVARQTRSSDFSAGREYEATRIGSSVSYGF